MLKSWLQRFLSAPSPAKSVAVTTPSSEIVTDIARQMDADVAGGFSTKDEIIQSIVDIHADDYGDVAVLRAAAMSLTDEAFRAHRLKQEEWPTVTDCDRLDAAFAQLEAEGVVSRQNFTCCGTCGSAEIWDEINSAKDAGKPARGYAFYHMQDTESAVDGYGLYLNYGSCEEGPEAAVAIGHEIIARLKDHDIKTEWDGRIERRIAVSLDWKRRRSDLSA